MFSSKPYTAVTATIERLTSETFAEDDLSGLPELVEAIRLQTTGPVEASRAIRKKLKYGNMHRQLRALVLLDGLIQNAGDRFRRSFANEPLLERLRVAGTSGLMDPRVRHKAREMFASWTKYKDSPGMEQVARLYKELPRRKPAAVQEKSRVIRETENPFGDEDGGAGGGERAGGEGAQVPYGQVTGTVNSFTVDSSSHKKTSSGGFFSSKKKGAYAGDGAQEQPQAQSQAQSQGQQPSQGRRRPFNLEEEKDNIKVAIADSSIATTNLMNALQSINREKERISENQAAVALFETCKQLRRRVFRYIHYVSDEQWLGSLLSANDQLVVALMTFEQLDRSINADSDSEDELAEQAHQYRMATLKRKETGASTSTAPGSPRSPSTRISSPPPMGLGTKSPPPRPSLASKPGSIASAHTGASASTGATTSEEAPRLPPRPRSSGVVPGITTSRADSSDEEDEDDDDPFADRNAVSTPLAEGREWA